MSMRKLIRGVETGQSRKILGPASLTLTAKTPCSKHGRRQNLQLRLSSDLGKSAVMCACLHSGAQTHIHTQEERGTDRDSVRQFPIPALILPTKNSFPETF